MNHRDLGETLNMVLSKGAFWQTHCYIGAFPHLPDPHLKHPMTPFSLYPSLWVIPMSQHSGFFLHIQKQIKLCAWQLREAERYGRRLLEAETVREREKD